MTGWYAASLTELKDLLDHIGQYGQITLEAGDDGVAAIIAMLNASSVIHLAAAHAAQVVTTFDVLENLP